MPPPPPTFAAVTGRPVVADAEEVAGNPRARSAKLRAAERTDAPPRGGDAASLLPALPSLAEVMRG
jgi:16S rRNA (cytosine1402-N4)-methyltransferase